MRSTQPMYHRWLCSLHVHNSCADIMKSQERQSGNKHTAAYYTCPFRSAHSMSMC